MFEAISSDPFLISTNYDKRLYEIAGKLQPVSIRDQMLRGYMLIKSAIKTNQIKSGQQLLIVGAGAAGVTAAMLAIEEGIQTTIIDKEEVAFSLQVGCTTRWVDPCQYDWPTNHWLLEDFPLPNSIGMMLPWSANNANNIASQWEFVFNNVRDTRSDILSFLPFTSLHSWYYPNETIEKVNVELETVEGERSTRETKEFDMVISCVGLGIETNKCGSCVGFKFWEKDPIEVQNFANIPFYQPSNDEEYNILISGGGDGALQDFLRVLIPGSSAKKIYQELTEDIDVKRKLEELELKIYGIEDQAHRSFVWNFSDKQDHAIMALLEESYNEIIDQLFNEDSLRNLVVSTLRRLTQDRINQISGLTMMYSCNHFSRCYALNHFLVLLLKKFFEIENQTKVTFLPGRKVVEMVGESSHNCGANPLGDDQQKDWCYGNNHTIFIKEKPLCYEPDPDARNMCSGAFNIIIIRHGIERDSSLSIFRKDPVGQWENPKSAVLRNRQTIPYYLHEF